MNTRLAELARQRESLICQSDAQREELAQSLRHVRKPIQVIRGVIAVLQTLKAHPALVMGFTTLLLSTRWRRWSRVRRWLQMGLSILWPLQAWRSKQQT